MKVTAQRGMAFGISVKNSCRIIGVILFGTLLMSGCAPRKFYFPRREVDKSVNTPEGARKLAARGAAFYTEDSMRYDYYSLIVPNVSYGISKKWSYVAFPLPVFQYAVFDQDEVVNDEVRLKGFSMGVMGGVNGFGYSGYNGFWVEWTAKLLTKLKVSEKDWCALNINGDFLRFNYMVGFRAGSELKIGRQLSDEVYVALSYIPLINGGKYYNYNSQILYSVFHEGIITAGYAPNRYFGAHIAVGVMVNQMRGDLTIPFELHLDFLW